jgi:DNA adenine methylase
VLQSRPQAALSAGQEELRLVHVMGRRNADGGSGMKDGLRAPFPWFGGKSLVADIIWQRFGRVDNYVEPFFGSGAVLLARKEIGKTETINDKDHFVANFWRSVQSDPESVARWADWPITETDLSARHYWLITEGADRIRTIDTDPSRYDCQVAGWWVWGLCSWIGSGWCSGRGPWQAGPDGWVHKNDLGNAGQGINRQLPHLGNAGQGINRKLPHLGNAGQGEFIRDWMVALAERLRPVRVCAGDWSRVCGPSVTHKHGLTAVFLDPPYAETAGRTTDLYSEDCLRVAHDVRAWAIDQGTNPLMRICLAGYDGEHAMPDDWAVIEWKAHGGYGSQNDEEDSLGRVNATRERLWFSPACIVPERQQRSFFDLMEAAE